GLDQGVGIGRRRQGGHAGGEDRAAGDEDRDDTVDEGFAHGSDSFSLFVLIRSARSRRRGPRSVPAASATASPHLPMTAIGGDAPRFPSRLAQAVVSLGQRPPARRSWSTEPLT